MKTELMIDLLYSNDGWETATVLNKDNFAEAMMGLGDEKSSIKGIIKMPKHLGDIEIDINANYFKAQYDTNTSTLLQLHEIASNIMRMNEDGFTSESELLDHDDMKMLISKSRDLSDGLP